MITRNIGIIPQSDKFGSGDLSSVAAAVSKQVVRDFAPLWHLSAHVAFFADEKAMPDGYWPCYVKDPDGKEDYAGYHSDQNGQPFIIVLAEGSLDNTAVTVSHEVLEALADPFGLHIAAASSIKPGQGRVSYLVEVCDPVENFAYPVDGIMVSAFVLSNYYHTVNSSHPAAFPAAASAHLGAHGIAAGGYLSWLDKHTGHWWLGERFQGQAKITFHDLGKDDGSSAARPYRSHRERIDRWVHDHRQQAGMSLGSRQVVQSPA